MSEKTMKEMQIEMCLNCRVGAEVLSRYGDICRIMEKEEEITEELKRTDNKFAFWETRERINDLYENLYSSAIETDIEKKYKALQKVKKDKGLMFEKIADESDRRAVEEISGLLHLEGTVFQKYQLLKKASENSHDGEGNACLAKLQPILCAARSIYDKRRRTQFSADKKTVLFFMHELNKESAENYDRKMGALAIKLFSRKVLDKDVEDLQKGIWHIFKSFIGQEVRDYKIEGNRQCGGALFLDRVAQIHEGNKPTTDQFYRRVGALCSGSQKIMMDYMQNAPKKFGGSLERVMEMQGMGGTDVAAIIDKKKLPGGIMALQNTKEPTHTVLTEDIPSICRALLVSEDVLYKGAGKIYGRWMNLLDDEGQRAVKEKAEEMNIPTGGKTKRDLTKFIRTKIRDIIEMKDEDFQKLMEDNPDLFEEREIYLYEDWECFDFLLHQKEAYVLLQALEKSDRQKRKSETADKD